MARDVLTYMAKNINYYVINKISDKIPRDRYTSAIFRNELFIFCGCIECWVNLGMLINTSIIPYVNNVIDKHLEELEKKNSNVFMI